MTKEEIELGMKCCSEFLCGECPYEKFDDNEKTLRCIHTLMKDINKLYFEEMQKQNFAFIWRKKMKRQGVCHDCKYRHSYCKYPSPYKTGNPCKHWRLGRCFVCVNYKEDLTEEEIDEWFKNCECWFPSGRHCSRFKRDWKKTIQEIIELIKK